MKPALVLHGGAGRIDRRTLPRCSALLLDVIGNCHELLDQGLGSLEAVTIAVAALEDSGLFNAGRGASLNTDGKAELDASIMDGRTLRAGAVAAVSRLRNPVLGARAVMEKTRHVMLVGRGAERFCMAQGVSSVGKNHYFAKRRKKHGTVGAVALDRDGNLAAATSTGGYWGKLPGRVGDSPVIGAGTWADNRSCAVSCTGVGEYFMRAAAAFDVSARMLHCREGLGTASSGVMREIRRLKGSGGLIAVDRKGAIAMPFSTPGMHRAWIDGAGRARVAAF